MTPPGPRTTPVNRITETQHGGPGSPITLREPLIPLPLGPPEEVAEGAVINCPAREILLPDHLPRGVYLDPYEHPIREPAKGNLVSGRVVEVNVHGTRTIVVDFAVPGSVFPRRPEDAISRCHALTASSRLSGPFTPRAVCLP